jgi:hypothetical protein
MRFFHGSSNYLEVGFVLRGRDDAYEASWSKCDFYKIPENNRPKHCLPHAKAVFAVGDPDDIDLAGGATEWIFELDPTGDVSRHDLNWSSEISYLLSEGHDAQSKEVLTAAANYWSGIAHPNESVWEYLMSEAQIVRVEPYEDFEPEGSADRSRERSILQVQG